MTDDSQNLSSPCSLPEEEPSAAIVADCEAEGRFSGSAEDLAVEAGAGDLQRIENLPKEVGAMLVSVGVLGFVLPGMMGTPAIIAGGLVLWPNTFQRVENWLQSRYPSLHRKGMKQIGRYLDDMERRFPPTSER